MKLQFNESQVSEANNLKVTIGALKLAGRIIPGTKRRGTVPCAKLSGTIACFGFHTRDFCRFFCDNTLKAKEASMGNLKTFGIKKEYWITRSSRVMTEESGYTLNNRNTLKGTMGSPWEHFAGLRKPV